MAYNLFFALKRRGVVLRSWKTYTVGMGLAPIRFPRTQLPSRMGASPIPTEELRRQEEGPIYDQ